MKKTISTVLNLVIAALFLLTACSSNVSTPTQSVTATKVPTATKKPLDIGSTMVGEDGAKLVYIPEGEFTMGRAADDALAECQKSRSDCQRSWFISQDPPHTVYLDAFWIDQTEVTNKQYIACVIAGKCNAPYESDAHTGANYFAPLEFDYYPVLNVDWEAAKAYCEWAGRRLPTEAEWEKAARGTDGRIYPWGNDAPNKDLVNVNYDLTEVGKYQKGKSFYGVYDMAGNVWEWVNDWYDENYYQSLLSSNPFPCCLPFSCHFSW